MNRLKTYIDLVKRGLPNIDKIMEGWVNDIKLDNNLLSQEEVDLKRLLNLMS